MIFKTCPYCGANLDPEEICDCQESKKQLERPTKTDTVHYIWDDKKGRYVSKS